MESILLYRPFHNLIIVPTEVSLLIVYLCHRYKYCTGYIGNWQKVSCISAMTGKFVEKNVDLTSSERDCGIFCTTNLHSDSQSHLFYCAFAVARTRALVCMFRFLYVVGRKSG
jgi:hypothetical protein